MQALWLADMCDIGSLIAPRQFLMGQNAEKELLYGGTIRYIKRLTEVISVL